MTPHLSPEAPFNLGSAATRPGVDSHQSPDEYLTGAQVARHLNVGLETVLGLRKRGHLPPACKFGKLVRWPRRVIEVWARERQEAPAGRRAPALQWQGQELQRLGNS